MEERARKNLPKPQKSPPQYPNRRRFPRADRPHWLIGQVNRDIFILSKGFCHHFNNGCHLMAQDPQGLSRIPLFPGLTKTDERYCSSLETKAGFLATSASVS